MQNLIQTKASKRSSKMNVLDNDQENEDLDDMQEDSNSPAQMITEDIDEEEDKDDENFDKNEENIDKDEEDVNEKEKDNEEEEKDIDDDEGEMSFRVIKRKKRKIESLDEEQEVDEPSKTINSYEDEEREQNVFQEVKKKRRVIFDDDDDDE